MVLITSNFDNLYHFLSSFASSIGMHSNLSPSLLLSLSLSTTFSSRSLDHYVSHSISTLSVLTFPISPFRLVWVSFALLQCLHVAARSSARHLSSSSTRAFTDTAPLPSTDLVASYEFWWPQLHFYPPSVFSDYPVISSLTHYLFSSASLNLHIFVTFPNVFLLLTSSFIPL